MKTERRMAAKAVLGRREFLRALGTGATVVAASVGPLSGRAVADNETSGEKRKSRYRASEHVKAFYRVNRY